MNKRELEGRTKRFAVDVMQLVDSLPSSRSLAVLANQLVRSGTSIGSNYREANRAESRKDFIHKIGVVEKEAAETEFWMELLVEMRVGQPEEVARLKQESSELLAIFAAIGRTTKRNSDSQMKIREGETDEPFDPELPLIAFTLELESVVPPNPKSEIVNPKSPSPNPKSEIVNPKSPLPPSNPKSEILNPK